MQADLKRLDKVGKPAPAFAAEDIKGQTVRLEAYRGKYVLVDFWATWCAPCIAELPRLQAAYRTYHDAGFEIIGVSLDESKTAVVDFAKARNLPWPQLHNASGSADLVEALRRELDPRDLPDRSRGDHHPARPARQGPRRDAGRLIKPAGGRRPTAADEPSITPGL